MLLHLSTRLDTALVRLDARRFGEPVVHSLGQELSDLTDRLRLRWLCLDLICVESISALGLGKLVAVHNKLRARGGCLRLLNPLPLVQNALETTRLVELFEVCRDGPMPRSCQDRLEGKEQRRWA
jgi:anti-anti-sigma factor